MMRYGFCIPLFLIVALSVFVRLRLADMPLERDEGEYAYAGQLMLQGIPPYKLAYNMKLPGTYAAYAVIMAAFGESSRGIHVGLIFVNALTILILYALARDMYGTVCGLTASASYALLSMSNAVFGLAAHATHFVTLFATLGALCLWKFVKTARHRTLLGAGFCFGVAFLMKQHAVFFIIFGGAVVLWQGLRKQKRDWKAGVTWTLIYGAAAVLPFAIACAILAATGVFPRFWFWTFSYAQQYASITPLHRGWANFVRAITWFRVSTPLFCLLTAFGFVVMARFESNRNRLFFSLGLLLSAFAAACPGLYFREHYFIPVLVPAAIFAGGGIDWLWREIGKSRQQKVSLVIPCVVFALACGDAIWRNGALWFRMGPVAASRWTYEGNPFPEAVNVANYIHDHSRPDSSIAVVGSEPEVYFYSARHSATGYIYTYPLMEGHPFARQMQFDMAQEIETRRPDYVVYVDVRKSWLPKPESDPSIILNWFNHYADTQLRCVGLIELFQDRPSTYRWEDKAVAVTPASTNYIKVFRRRDLP